MHPLFAAVDAGSTLEAIFKVGYGDLFGLPIRILNFRVDVLSPIQAAEMLRLIGEYSDRFNGEDVAEAILGLADARMIQYVNLGRALSPVLQVAHVFETEDLDDPRLATIAEVFKALGADEIDPDGPNLVRAWWD